ncbi:hypothetical protein [Peribacillus deserti]|uniref:Uncharacterized protein n=1 Tax=Peribacillus deserti TaxID=673318 RepID=A0A2N5M649_9BACI|nr:hypothetical protein [Peribacillus deserti]PLT29829.1 hypothetical protein CUU66_11035 [Peribacillus deserti]
MTTDEKKENAQHLFNKNAEASSFQAQLTRVNCAISIFKNGLEQEVLNDIAASASKRFQMKELKRQNN